MNPEGLVYLLDMSGRALAEANKTIEGLVGQIKQLQQDGEAVDAEPVAAAD